MMRVPDEPQKAAKRLVGIVAERDAALATIKAAQARLQTLGNDQLQAEDDLLGDPDNDGMAWVVDTPTGKVVVSVTCGKDPEIRGVRVHALAVLQERGVSG